jgi:tyrosine-specific transport protein
MALREHSSIISMSMVITGNMVGAGILATPVITGLSGLIPAFIGIVATWFLMTVSALVISNQRIFAEDGNADLPALYRKELGNFGQWVAVAANLLILYGMLIAYMSGIVGVVSSVTPDYVPSWVIMVLFFLVAGGISVFGMTIMTRGNNLFMALLWLAFIAMLIMASRKVDPSRFTYMDWSFLPATLPVILTAFGFHPVIPTICHSLQYDRKSIRLAILTGSSLGLIMNLLWIVVVMGAVPVSGSGTGTLVYAFEKNMPATIPLAQLIASPWFTTVALFFASMAIFTSYITLGTATINFWKDLIARPNMAIGLAFLPPLLVALIYPDIFLMAINIVGGIGTDLLFGFFPALLLLRYGMKGIRWFGVVMMMAFLIVLVLEIGQECGLLSIAPAVESWMVPY